MEGRFLVVSTNVCFGFDLAILFAHTLVVSFGVRIVCIERSNEGDVR